MSFHSVYANGRSICNKSGNGKSAAAFPDVCWTPPQSSPIPVPYPNTAYARDLTKGTKTVFIKGTEVAKTMGVTDLALAELMQYKASLC